MEKGKRLFTKEELEEFSKDFMGLAMEALERGDIEKAKFWIRRHDVNKDGIHDLYMNWITALLSHIYDQYGEDAAAHAVRETVVGGQSGWGIQMGMTRQQIMAGMGREQGLKVWIGLVVDMWREHSMYPGTTFEEDDEKIIMTMKQCGSGGRLIEKGAYEGPFGYKKFKKAAPYTWGEENLPLYCSHCVWAHEIAPIIYTGEPLWVQPGPFPKKPGDPCIYHFYKDAKDIPDKYYQRIGLTREPRALPPTFGIDPVKNAASKWPK
jgi:hypothetical protein